MKRNLTKEELTKKLAEQGVVTQGTITNIKQMCTLKGIPLDNQQNPAWLGRESEGNAANFVGARVS